MENKTDYEVIKEALQRSEGLPWYDGSDGRLRFDERIEGVPRTDFTTHERKVPLYIETDDLGIGVGVSWWFTVEGKLILCCSGGSTEILSPKEVQRVCSMTEEWVD